MNSQLILYSWPDEPTIVDQGNPNIATITQKHEKVFVYGVEETRETLDKANESIILKRFGKSQVYKKNLMANNHMEAVDLNKANRGGNLTLNQQRVQKIKEIDEKFARFFLGELMTLTWKDFANGVQTTIPFEEAFDMLKKATAAYYDLMTAFVNDTYNRDLAISEMKNVLDVHQLNNEYSLGKTQLI